ncbi:MAG TPA: AEC family transporter [Candidatus Didemnitutus sp.]|nr:AEC family transporter [Candidatus Didemnitutus sp.]
MLVVAVLAPVFLVIALGAVLQRTGFVSAGFLREANRVTYWLGLPALLFSQLVTSFHEVTPSARVLLWVMFAATGLVIALAYLVAWLCRVPGAALGTFVQGAFRGNLAFVGLPIIFAFPETAVAGGLSLRSAAVLVVAPAMVLYNTAGVVVLLLSQHRFGPKMAWPFVKQLATTPPLVATLAGIGWALAGWTLPVPVAKTFESLGEMALPLGLLGVGGSLMTVKLGANWRPPLGSALVKTAVSPLCGWVVAHWWGLRAEETRMILILMACPTAVVSYTVALEMQGDESIASGTIVLSVILSLVTLATVVGFF